MQINFVYIKLITNILDDCFYFNSLLVLKTMAYLLYSFAGIRNPLLDDLRAGNDKVRNEL